MSVSITLRRTVMIFLPMAAMTAALVWALHRSEYRAELTLLSTRETQRLGLQSRLVAQALRGISADLMILAGHREMKEVVNGSGDSRDALAREFLIASSAKGYYDQIRFLNQDGMETVRVNYGDGHPYVVPPEGLQGKSHRYYFTESIGLDPGQIYMSPFDLNVESGQIEQPLKPMIRFATAVADDVGTTRGVVVLNYLGRRLLDDLATLEAGSPQPTMLLNSEGYWLRGPVEADEWAFMYPGRLDRNFQHAFPDAWATIASADEGQFFLDDRLFSFSSIDLADFELASVAATPLVRSSAGGGWKLVTVIPRNEMTPGADTLLRIMAVISTFLLVALLAASWVIASAWMRRQRAEEARERTIEQLEEALANVKTLSDLLPICANCKNIRDDAGYWHRVEVYIGDRAGVNFSHGLCPDCLPKFFPQKKNLGATGRDADDP